MRFRFADCLLDADRFELWRGGERVEVQPKVLELLLFLLGHRDRTLTKDEILESVWSDVSTSEGSLTRAISLARTALGETQRDGEIIYTVRGRGYRIGVPVVEESGAQADADGPPDEPASGFLCRDKELGLAKGALLRALGGRGQVLLLTGEPGIGKTRMAEEIAVIAGQRGAQVFWGRCFEGEGGPAFWPWVQILRALLGQQGPEALRECLGDDLVAVAELLPELRRHFPDLPPSPARGADAARFRLFDSITTLLRAAAAKRALLLVLDDLHRADVSSLQLLQFLAQDIRDVPILVTATYRDVEVTKSDPLEITLAELARSQSPKRTIFLRGLTQTCVRNFVREIMGVDPDDALVEAVYQRTEGNPLFLVEVLHWIQGRDPSPASGGAEKTWQLEIPEGVRQVIRRRLSGLSEACRHVLAEASAVGREFSLRVLAPACELSPEAALELLEEAELVHVVEGVRGGPGRFRFSHALIAETLYEDLSTAARVRVHGRIAAVIESLYTPRSVAPTDAEISVDPSHLAELAHHCCEASVGGDTRKATEYSALAGRHATVVLAFEEAVRHFERALSVRNAGTAAGSDGSLLLELADARRSAGDPAACGDALWRAVAVARAASEVECLAEAAIRISRYKVGGNVLTAVPQRIEVLEEAVERISRKDSRLRARLLSALAGELYWGDDSAGRDAISREAQAMAKRLGDPRTTWEVAFGSRPYQIPVEKRERRQALVDEIFQLAREIGGASREFVARHDYRLPLFVENAEPEAIDRELAVCERLAAQLREPEYRYYVARAQGARAMWQGRFDDAEGFLDRARGEGQHFDRDIAVLSHQSAMGVLRRLQGRAAELEPHLLAKGRLPRDRGHKWAALALHYANSGRGTEARAEFEALAADGFSRVRRDSNYAINLALLAETCVKLADRGRAVELLELLLPYRRLFIHIPTIVAAGCGSRYVGLLAALLGRTDLAGEAFEESLEIERRMSALPFEALTEWSYASMLDDSAEVDRHRSRAREIAGSIGLQLPES